VESEIIMMSEYQSWMPGPLVCACACSVSVVGLVARSSDRNRGETALLLLHVDSFTYINVSIIPHKEMTYVTVYYKVIYCKNLVVLVDLLYMKSPHQPTAQSVRVVNREP